MTSTIEDLEFLSNSIDLVKSKQPAQPVLTSVIEKIHHLNSQLLTESHTADEWSRIYDTLEPYSKVDLTPKETSLLSAIKTIFNAVVYGTPKTIAGNLLQSVGKKRVQALDEQASLEKDLIRKQWRSFFLSISIDCTDPQAIKASILKIRSAPPRLVVSLQEELSLAKEELKKIHPEQNERLVQFQSALETNLFSLEGSIKTAFKKGSDVLLLVPEAKAFDPSTISKLRIARLYRLTHLEQTYQESRRDPRQSVAAKYFPPTSAWYVGAFQKLPNFSLLEIEMQSIGKENGIYVLTDRRVDDDLIPIPTTSRYRPDIMLDCAPLINAAGFDALGPFTQDFVDFSLGGEVRVPRLKTHMEGHPGSPELEAELLQRRNTRSPEWKEISTQVESPPVEVLGAVFADDLPFKALALAGCLGCAPVMNLTYNEGGNTLIGQRASGPYVIIGLDSYDASKKFMESDLGRQVTHEEVKLAFAIDYGIRLEDVYFVEQPGDFHLDMSMAIIGENTVLINDAVQAQELFAEDQQEWTQNAIQKNQDYAIYIKKNVKASIEEAPVRKKMEDVAARQLEKQGFNVIRVPGKFQYTGQAPAMNLFNMVTAETPSGKNIVIFLGCINTTYEQFFMDTLNKHSGRKIDKFYFLNTESSQESLSRFGGISCRTKTIPRE